MSHGWIATAAVGHECMVLRGFSTSVGQFIANAGALSNGQGNIFLWMFCALAFLKTAQKFDSYLAAMGLNVAQTGSSMGMEILMAARVLSGVGGAAKSAGNVFNGGSSAAGGTAASSFAAGFASKFKGNSYVRDAVVNGGTRMGAGGGFGFVGRAFGGIAARNGATLTGESISSVASRTPNVSGSIAGEIADRSLGNYMPQLGNHKLSGTQITGGHISTTATGADGKAQMWNCIMHLNLKTTRTALSGYRIRWYTMVSNGKRRRQKCILQYTGIYRKRSRSCSGCLCISRSSRRNIFAYCG